MSDPNEPPGLLQAVLEQACHAGPWADGANGGSGLPVAYLEPSSFRQRANSLGLTAALIALDEKVEAGDDFAGAVEVLAVSDGMTALMNAPDHTSAAEGFRHSVRTSMALKAQFTGLSKLYRHGYKHPTVMRRIFYNKNKAAEAYKVWQLPCLAQTEGRTYQHAFIYVAWDKEESQGSYAALIQEHLGLAFTPAIVSVLNNQGLIVYQNAASMAALGVQGLKHCAAGCHCSFNLLEELFAAEPQALQEMRAVTQSNDMWCKVLKIRSKELRKWLGSGVGDVWHQVQVSHTLCPETLQDLFVVAQVDVTADILAQHRLAVLQAENKDLHYTTVWLEEQKEKVHETNLRLKESLVEALAARDMSLECEDTFIDIESPTDKAIQLLNKFLEGQEVTVREVLAVRDVLLAAGPDDFLQPVNFREQMDAQMTGTMDEDVGRSLMDMLLPTRGLSISRPSHSSFTSARLTPNPSHTCDPAEDGEVQTSSSGAEDASAGLPKLGMCGPSFVGDQGLIDRRSLGVLTEQGRAGSNTSTATVGAGVRKSEGGAPASKGGLQDGVAATGGGKNGGGSAATPAGGGGGSGKPWSFFGLGFKGGRREQSEQQAKHRKSKSSCGGCSLGPISHALEGSWSAEGAQADGGIAAAAAATAAAAVQGSQGDVLQGPSITAGGAAEGGRAAQPPAAPEAGSGAPGQGVKRGEEGFAANSVGAAASCCRQAAGPCADSREGVGKASARNRGSGGGSSGGGGGGAGVEASGEPLELLQAFAPFAEPGTQAAAAGAIASSVKQSGNPVVTAPTLPTIAPPAGKDGLAPPGVSALTASSAAAAQAVAASAAAAAAQNQGGGREGALASPGNSQPPSIPLPLEAAAQALQLGGDPFVHALHALWESGHLKTEHLSHACAPSANTPAAGVGAAGTVTERPRGCNFGGFSASSPNPTLPMPVLQQQQGGLGLRTRHVSSISSGAGLEAGSGLGQQLRMRLGVMGGYGGGGTGSVGEGPLPLPNYHHPSCRAGALGSGLSGLGLGIGGGGWGMSPPKNSHSSFMRGQWAASRPRSGPCVLRSHTHSKSVTIAPEGLQTDGGQSGGRREVDHMEGGGVGSAVRSEPHNACLVSSSASGASPAEVFNSLQDLEKGCYSSNAGGGQQLQLQVPAGGGGTVVGSPRHGSSSIACSCGRSNGALSRNANLVRGPGLNGRTSLVGHSMRSSSSTGEADVDGEDSGYSLPVGSCPTCSSLTVATTSQRPGRATQQDLLVCSPSGSSPSFPPTKHVAAMMHMWRNPPDHLAPVLAAADEWWWDAFELNDATNGRPLSTLAFALLTRHYVDELKGCCVDETRLARFLMRLEDAYLDNPYHNRVHATDVLQWTHMLMKRGGVLRSLQLCDAGTLAAILSAVVHDVGHKGLNNDFLIRSGDTLALLYNDMSPMENHHLAATFQLLAQDHYNFLARAPKEVRDTIRKQIITMVLATDMKQHFSHTSLFKSKVGASAHETEDSLVAPVNVSGASQSQHQQPQPHAPTAADAQPEPTAAVAAAELEQDDELKSLALAVALKCADLGNLAAPKEVHKRWVAHLEEEYFQQGDREKVNGMQVSPLMDRNRAGVSKSQPGFFSIVGRPLFKTFTQAFPGARPILDGANANFAYWKKVEEERNQQQASSAGQA
ncbi:hypothetical protein DUNSADRAFT_2175 [Dunaliella salina]|uniref:Phosphodiesterase n=1 Tax=Dunaliella salina TaxID=3046 RepID=A0ABQ7H8H4_DUNSA|nr:hypothetical protein DUNSADRAFT_2175 [Dunaliella salina]|eukprot:KAF5843139.1 hypothetical protein DUNSADRAFT_2175 [Dunaliella salina]